MSYEAPEEAKVLLNKAVSILPNALDLWLALAKLEDYKNARAVLNRALAENAQSVEVYISACKLEEAQNENIEMMPKIVKRMIKNLQISRESYL